jgi:hypothetical protein
LAVLIGGAPPWASDPVGAGVFTLTGGAGLAGPQADTTASPSATAASAAPRHHARAMVGTLFRLPPGFPER